MLSDANPVHRSSVPVWGYSGDDPRWDRLRRGVKRVESFYVAMLTDDLRHRLHLGGYRHESAFRVELVGDSTDDVRETLIGALSVRDNRRTLERAVSEFFEVCGVSLLLSGRASYEVAVSEAGLARPQSVSMLELPGGTVRRRLGGWYQYVPSRAMSSDQAGGWIKLDTQMLMNLSLDRSLWRSIDWALDALVDIHHAEMAQLDLLAGPRSRDVELDVTHLHRLAEVAVGRVTARLGWDARKSLTREWSEPFLVYRALRFKRFSVELRDSILLQLNRALVRHERRLGFEVQLLLHGLPSLQEIDAAISEIATAGRSLDQLAEFAMR